MKKFSVILFFLFGFFIIFPQIVLADLALPPGFIPKHKQKEIEKELKQKYSICLQKHKLDLPKEYKGPNLGIITNSIESKYKTYKSGPMHKSDIPFHTGNEYFIHTDSQTDTNMVAVESLAFDCNTEYVEINGRINVTDIPTGSHLKYIPESDELQVLSSSEELNTKDKLGSMNKLREQIQQGLNKKYAKDFQCVSEKKDKVSAKYTGPNLKPETIFQYTNISRLQKNSHCMNKYLSFDNTGNKYNIDLQNENIISHESYGQVCGCEEYITTFVDRSRQVYIYKVTDVPPGSTLKYLPETKEMQVFPLTKEDMETKFKEELKIKDKLMCLYKKKLNLPKEYKGSNLKLQTDKKSKKQISTGLGYFHVFRFNNPLYDRYHNNVYRKSNVHIQNFSSVIVYDETDCKEYIVVNGNTYYYQGKKYNVQRIYRYNRIYRDNNWYYDVTNVPPGSYLKYIPETKEFQIFPEKDNSYKKLIKDKIKEIENKEAKLQEDIAIGNLKSMVTNLEEFKKSFIKGINLKGDQTKAEEIYKQEIEREKELREESRNPRKTIDN